MIIPMREARVLVTGATGFIGSELVLTLAGQGCRVVALARDARSSRTALELAREPNVSVVEADLLCASDLLLKFQEWIHQFDISAVFHCAAESNAEKCESDRALATQINVEATRLLTQACAAKGIPLFFFSTDMVFSDPPIGPNFRFSESDIPRPRGVYPETKYQAEISVLAYRRGYVLRNTLTLGLSKVAPQRGVLAGMLRELDRVHHQRQSDAGKLESNYLNAFEDEWRTPISLKQIMDSCLALLNRHDSGQVPRLLNLTGKERVSRFQMAKIVAEHFGYPIKLIKAIKRETYHGAFNRPSDCSLCGQLTESALNIPCRGLSEGLMYYAQRVE